MCCIVVFNFFLFCLSMDSLCLTQINNNNIVLIILVIKYLYDSLNNNVNINLK